MKVYPFVCIHERNEVINMNEKTFNDVVNHMKTSGFVYQGSEIYGGLANTWDFGPLGIELKNNIKNAWWKRFIQESEHNVGLQSAILMNPNVWVASGHVGGFSDPLMDCKECNERFRADKLIEDYAQENGIELEGSVETWKTILRSMKSHVQNVALKTSQTFVNLT